MTAIAIAIVGRAIIKEKAIKKRVKELIPKMKKKRLRGIHLQRAIEKSAILLSQYWKINSLGAPILFSPTVEYCRLLYTKVRQKYNNIIFLVTCIFMY